LIVPLILYPSIVILSCKSDIVLVVVIPPRLICVASVAAAEVAALAIVAGAAHAASVYA
jgi:hypothetical protein